MLTQPYVVPLGALTISQDATPGPIAAAYQCVPAGCQFAFTQVVGPAPPNEMLRMTAQILVPVPAAAAATAANPVNIITPVAAAVSAAVTAAGKAPLTGSRVTSYTSQSGAGHS